MWCITCSYSGSDWFSSRLVYLSYDQFEFAERKYCEVTEFEFHAQLWWCITSILVCHWKEYVYDICVYSHVLFCSGTCNIVSISSSLWFRIFPSSCFHLYRIHKWSTPFQSHHDFFPGLFYFSAYHNYLIHGIFEAMTPYSEGQSVICCNLRYRVIEVIPSYMYLPCTYNVVYCSQPSLWTELLSDVWHVLYIQ